MTILGIKNRTENWKTARHFYPFFEQGPSTRLARRLGEPEDTEPGDVHLQLYWKGMRDYLHKKTPFVVGDDSRALKKSHQVRFVSCQGWMKKEKVLEWGKVKELTCDYGGRLW